MFKYRDIETNAEQFVLRLHQSGRRTKGAGSERNSGYPRVKTVFTLSFVILFFSGVFSQSPKYIYKKLEIGDRISPKSIVASGHGVFSAQNMMYCHSITLYDKTGKLLASISDEVDLNQLGFPEYKADDYLGGPVEAAFSNNGKTLWVSNYNMIGQGFDKPGCDGCNGKNYDPGFIYKINVETFQIEKAIKVGSVPKYLAISKDEKRMVVSNWSSGDVSIVDLVSEKEIKKVDVGAHPRGIAISSNGQTAFVTVMGSTKIAKVNLKTYTVSYLEDIGKSPRHIVLSENDSLLYVSLNSSNSILKYNVITGEKQSCKTNAGPRTMVLSPDQKYLYVVNYFANTFSKISADSMTVLEVVSTGHHPIGITANWEDAEIWVACYEGKIEIFKDFKLAKEMNKEDFIFEDELALFLKLFQPDFRSGVPAKSDTLSQISDEEDAGLAMHETAESETTLATQTEIRTSSGGKKTTGGALPIRVIERGEQSQVVPNTTGVSAENNSCDYHVIVGSFSIPENATAYRSTVEKKGYPATLIESSKGLTYVSAACYASREDATAAISEIYAVLDVKGWVLKR